MDVKLRVSRESESVSRTSSEREVDKNRNVRATRSRDARRLVVHMLCATAALAWPLLCVTPLPAAPARVLMLADDDPTLMHRKAEELRADLAEAVAVEHFELATRIRNELTSLEQDERLAVLDINERFYAALRQHDEEAMESLWADGSLAADCHRSYPGFPTSCGRDAILRTWLDVTSDRHTQIGDLNCKLLRGGVAVVPCSEWRLGWVLDGSVAAPTNADDDMLCTTNVFEKGLDGRWRLILHQACPRSTEIERADDAVDYDASDFPGATG